MFGRRLVGQPAQAQQHPLVVLADVPALAHERPALDRLELVAPDPPGHELPQEPAGTLCQAIRRSCSNSITVDTIEYLMPICIDMPKVDPRPSSWGSTRLDLLHRARAVDVGVAGGVGDQGEDGCGPGGDAPARPIRRRRPCVLLWVVCPCVG